MVVIDIESRNCRFCVAEGAQGMSTGKITNLLGKCHHILLQSQSFPKKDPVHKVQSHIWDCIFWNNNKKNRGAVNGVSFLQTVAESSCNGSHL